MPSPLTTDIAIIGAGTAGLTAFSTLQRLGIDAVLIDHGPLGTTCAREGCMPSKAALHASHRWAILRKTLRDASVPAGASTADELWQHARTVRDDLVAGTVRRTRTMAGDRLVMGAARFTGADTLDVDGRRIRARAFIVATGSRPVVPKALAALGDRVLTTDSLFELSHLPRSVGVIGLGAIGLEMGLALSRLGVQVSGGDVKALPAGIVDPDIGARAIARFGTELTMWLGAPVDARDKEGGIELRSGEHTAQVEAVLVALGRRPNVETLELARAGVPLDGQGLPVVDPHTLRAGSSRVFLAGDVSALRPLMHEAVDEGMIAARAAANLLDGRAIPHATRRTPLTIMFSDPDVAAVGLASDKLELDATVIGSAHGATDGRSRIMRAEDNLVRVYVDRASRRLLGAALIASRGEHLAHLLAWAVQRRETVDDLLAMPYYHPSIEEMVQTALKDAARQLSKSARIPALA